METKEDREAFSCEACSDIKESDASAVEHMPHYYFKI